MTTGDGTTMAVERGQNIWNMTSGTGSLGQDNWDRTSRTGQLGQDSWDRTALTGRPDGRPGQVSLERTEMTELPGNDSGVWRAVDKWPGQGSWNRRTAGTGQPEQDRLVQDRITWTGYLGPDNWDKTTETGRTG
jgi:hypothetical protein